MVKSIFTVIEGGERTYIHPVSVDEVHLFNNRMQFLRTPEFALHQRDDKSSMWVGFHAFMYRLRGGGWFTKLVDRIRYHVTVWKYIVRHKLYRHAEGMYNSINPVFCADIFEPNLIITVPGAMHVSSNGMKLTDSCYLIPSNDYLVRKLLTWLFDNNFSHPEFDTKARNDYLKWASEQTRLGRRVILLSSLDT